MFRLVPLVAVLLTASCVDHRPARDDRASDLSDLHGVLENDRRAHLQTDVALLVSHLDDSVVSLDDGEISVQSREAIERSFRAYFAGAEYRAWEDLEPPVIRMSADQQMAWVARRVRVDRDEPTGTGEPRRVRFTSAYLATYRKTDEGWRMTAVASTFAPAYSTIP